MTKQYIHSFFEKFEAATNRGDNEELVSLYAETFIFGGQQGTPAVKRDDFKMILPKRQEFFKSIGLVTTKLVSLDATSIDEKYSLVKVTWKITFAKNDQKIEDDTLATYILFHNGDESKIALQIDHQDLMERVKRLGLLRR